MRDAPGSIYGEPISRKPQPITSIRSNPPPPAADEPASDPYLEEMERLCDRLERMECIRTPELLRAAAVLLDVYPEYKRLRTLEKETACSR